MRAGLTCLCFRCTRKRFLLNEILTMFPLQVSDAARDWLRKRAGEKGDVCGHNTHQGKKLEQIILWNIATPLEAKPTIKGAPLVSLEETTLQRRKCVLPPLRFINGAVVTMALCSSTPYNSSVRAVLRKQSSASLCLSPLECKQSRYN